MANTDSVPANGAQGSSHIYDYNSSPNTRAAISQKVRLLSPVYKPGTGSNSLLYQLGVCSSMSADFNRGVEDIRGIGFGDQIAERVPGVSDPVDVSIERTLLYLSNLGSFQSLGLSYIPTLRFTSSKGKLNICSQSVYIKSTARRPRR